MSNDLDLYSNGGQVVPWDPASTPLAPVADDWNDNPVDYLSEHSLTTHSGALAPEVEQFFNQLASVFLNDASYLGIDFEKAQKAMSWFRQNLTNPPQGRQPRNHGYNLHEHAVDELFNAFAVQARKWNWTQQQISHLCWWVSECTRRIDAMQNNGGAYQGSPPATDGTFNSNGQLDVDSLSDAAYDRLVAINETAKSRTTAALQRRWGDAYLQNLAVAQEVLSNLPASHQAYLSQYNPQTWVSGLSEESTILGLFDMAVGKHSLPNGAAIQSEINSIENLMRTNSKAYRSDNRIQARLRVLYGLRDNGR